MANRWGDDDPLGRATARGEPELDFTSLIDVVFLLLIFFMYSAALSSMSEVDMPMAVRGTGVDPTQSTIITIFKNDALSDPPFFILGDGAADDAQERGSLEEVRTYIQEGVRNGKLDVILKAEREVPHRVVLDVARVAAEIDGVKLAVAVKEAPP